MKVTSVKNDSCVVAVRPPKNRPIPDFAGPRPNTWWEEAGALCVAVIVFG